MNNSTRLSLVGGVRKVSTMIEAIKEGSADFISMSRPLIRDSAFVRKIRDGESDESQCTNCNTCAGGLFSDQPVVHYPKEGRFPKRIGKKQRLWDGTEL